MSVTTIFSNNDRCFTSYENKDIYRYLQSLNKQYYKYYVQMKSIDKTYYGMYVGDLLKELINYICDVVFKKSEIDYDFYHKVKHVEFQLREMYSLQIFNKKEYSIISKLVAELSIAIKLHIDNNEQCK